MCTHSTSQSLSIPHCPGVTVLTGDILSLITHSQHKEAQQTRPISVVPPTLSLSLPSCFDTLTVIFFHSVWDWGWGVGEKSGSKQGQKEKERLAPTNNPFFQHMWLHISKLKLSARKKGGLLNIKRPLAASRQPHPTPPISALEACRALCAVLALQSWSKLKSYITQLIRPWERGLSQSFWG